jgi:hypothetical protein
MSRSILCVAALLALSTFAIGCKPDLEGHVILNGQQDHSGILVFVSASRFAEDSVVTDVHGHYSFRITTQDVRYYVEARAPSTLEKTQEVYVDGQGDDLTAPDMIFTPVGEVAGLVNVAAGPKDGVLVAAEGTQSMAVTDASGAYVLSDVPVGTVTVIASAPGHTAARSDPQVVTYAKRTMVPTLDVN